MPDLLLYWRASIAAFAVGLSVHWVFGRIFEDSRRFSWLARLLGWLAGAGTGTAILGLPVTWFPATGLERLFTVVLPAAATAEFCLAWSGASSGWRRAVRGGLFLGSVPVLLWGSVYLQGDRGNGSAGALVGGVLLLSLLAWGILEWLCCLEPRLPAGTVILGLGLALGAAGMMILLGGYVRGGSVAFPLAAATWGVGWIRARSTECATGSLPTIGLVFMTLYGLVFVGHFFGSLSVPEFLATLVSPLGGWLAVGWWRERRPAWQPAALAIFLMAIPLVIVLILAKRRFDERLGPLLDARPGKAGECSVPPVRNGSIAPFVTTRRGEGLRHL